MIVAGVVTLAILRLASAPVKPESNVSPRATTSNGRSAVAVLFAAVGSGAILSVLGAGKLISFLTSGSQLGRLSLMFSPINPGSLAGQGTGTSVQGATLVGAQPFYGATSQDAYIGYILNGRTFITAEGGLTKTWLELGIVGVILYAGVFFSALAPLIRNLTRLDGTSHALTVLAIGLGVIFLKGHQSLDDVLVQPLFWLAVGGAWGRMRSSAAKPRDERVTWLSPPAADAYSTASVPPDRLRLTTCPSIDAGTYCRVRRWPRPRPRPRPRSPT